jgi:hypothetical protein
MTIRDDVQPTAPPQHFDISATPAETSGTAAAEAAPGYNPYSLGEAEIGVGPTAYATPIHDDHSHLPIIQASTLPMGGGGESTSGGGPTYYTPNYNSTPNPPNTNSVAVVTGAPQPPSVAVVTGAPQPPTALPPNYTSSGTRRTDGEKCCIISGGIVVGVVCLCCIIPFIILVFVKIATEDQDVAPTPVQVVDDFYDNGFGDDFFNND